MRNSTTLFCCLMALCAESCQTSTGAIGVSPDPVAAAPRRPTAELEAKIEQQLVELRDVVDASVLLPRGSTSTAAWSLTGSVVVNYCLRESTPSASALQTEIQACVAEQVEGLEVDYVIVVLDPLSQKQCSDGATRIAREQGMPINAVVTRHFSLIAGIDSVELRLPPVVTSAELVLRVTPAKRGLPISPPQVQAALAAGLAWIDHRKSGSPADLI